MKKTAICALLLVPLALQADEPARETRAQAPLAFDEANRGILTYLSKAASASLTARGDADHFDYAGRGCVNNLNAFFDVRFDEVAPLSAINGIRVYVNDTDVFEDVNVGFFAFDGVGGFEFAGSASLATSAGYYSEFFAFDEPLIIDAENRSYIARIWVEPADEDVIFGNRFEATTVSVCRLRLAAQP